MWGTLMRWVRVRGLKEGRMQSGRVETFDDEARDDAVRPQDYGLASNPVDGEGLRLEIGGHTVIVRVDRAGERPQLDAYEVALWHREGHMVKLKADGVIEITGVRLVVQASEEIALASPVLTHNGVNIGSDHDHGNVQNGGGRTSGPG